MNNNRLIVVERAIMEDSERACNAMRNHSRASLTTTAKKAPAPPPPRSLPRTSTYCISRCVIPETLLGDGAQPSNHGGFVGSGRCDSWGYSA